MTGERRTVWAEQPTWHQLSINRRHWQCLTLPSASFHLCAPEPPNMFIVLSPLPESARDPLLFHFINELCDLVKIFQIKEISLYRLSEHRISGQSAQKNYFSDRRAKSKHIHKSPPHSLIFFFFSSAFYGLSPVQGLPRPFNAPPSEALSAASSCLTSTDFTSSVTLSIHKSALCSSSGPLTLTLGSADTRKMKCHLHTVIVTFKLNSSSKCSPTGTGTLIITQKTKQKTELKINHFM